MARVTTATMGEQQLTAIALEHSDLLTIADFTYLLLGLLMVVLVIVNDWPAVISLLMWGRV